MTKLLSTHASLTELIEASAGSRECFVQDHKQQVTFGDLLAGSALYGRGSELEGKSVLLATKDQLTTVAALIELDGVARRVILCSSDLPLEHFPYVIETAEVDGIISDRAPMQFGKARPVVFMPCSRNLVPRTPREEMPCETEWVMLTSGTTGLPKLVAHTLSSLTAGFNLGNTQPPAKTSSRTWSTFYDIRRYGGLQILLRALIFGTSLVLSSSEEPVSNFLARAGASGVTHISGTPSHWRRALMSGSIQLLHPEYVRLSGEAVDQAILDNLRSAFPQARLVHAFASTEAGLAFEVPDGLAGFPADVLTNATKIEMRIDDSILRIRSAGCARCYLGANAPVLKDADGFVRTNDEVELEDGRYYFAGRRDGVINVGGQKVHPEQVEAVIARHPDVQMCLVRAKKSPITGALVVADVVLKTASSAENADKAAMQSSILQLCREVLPPYKVPAAIHVVSSLALDASGKVMRRNA
jgi:acyl-coenzyme A synthetase/AMP-(fatty) acid ligase